MALQAYYVTVIIIIIFLPIFMVLSSWHSHCESSPGSFDECRLSTRWPPTHQTNRFGLWVRRKIGCYHPQTPSPFIIITQLVSWYPFYRPTEGGRLSQPRHCSKGAQRAQGCMLQWLSTVVGDRPILSAEYGFPLLATTDPLCSAVSLR